MYTHIKRRIHFYRVRVVNPVDSGDEDTPEFDPRAACDAIDQLPFTVGERYFDLDDERAVCVWPMCTSTQVRMGVGIIRRSNFPLLERAGVVYPMQMHENESMVEQIHVAFFRDNIVVAEYNHFGPRMSALSKYLERRIPNQPRIEFDHLVNPSVVEKLQHLEDVRLVDIKIKRGYAEILRDADQSVPAAIRSVGEMYNASTIALTLQAASRRKLNSSVRDFIRRMASNPMLKDGATRAIVAGTDDRTGEELAVDLLKDHLVFDQKVLKADPRYKVVNSDEMLSALNYAYSRMESELEKATTLEF